MNFKHEYLKIKQQYIELKQIIFKSNSNMIGGIRSDGTYNMDGNLYLVRRTEDNKRFSFKEEPFSKFDKYDLTSNTKKPDKTKILYINDEETFDWFSLKYAQYDQFHMYVEWDKVAMDYKGFYLNKDNKDLYLRKHGTARKGSMGKFRSTSWWVHEYDKLTYNVMIFD
jgi:hypothetical protein